MLDAPAKTRSWRPLLDGDLAVLARARLDELVVGLSGNASDPTLGEAAGRALLFAQLEQADMVDAQLCAALAGVNDLGPGLHEGIAGVAFAFSHLGIEVDPNVAQLLVRTLPHLHHDLIKGVGGIGVFALEGMPATAELLTRTIAVLDKTAIPAGRGRCLFTNADFLGPELEPSFPYGATDLGVAHGQGGPIAVAAAAAAWGIPKARALYRDLVVYLWSQARSGMDARFPTLAEIGRPARSAWCYGDPGVAAALLSAADAIGDEEGHELARDLAALAAQRAPQATEVADPNLCHGAIGLAHLFNRIAQATADAEFGEVARTWYSRALAMPRPEKSGLLDGQLGVALALHAAVSEIEPSWDRVLCASVRTPW